MGLQSLVGSALIFIAGLLAASTGCAQPAGSAQVARGSTVYLYFDVTDPASGSIAKKHGTGFVITGRGHVLTASHLFDEWRKQTDAHRSANPIQATIGALPGTSPSPVYKVIMINPGEPRSDIAVLKLPEPTEEEYPRAAVCFGDSVRPVLGETLVSYGFPYTAGFQPVPFTFGSETSEGRWGGASDFDSGMSGGPVYVSRNGQDFVVGMVNGGLAGSTAVRWITPIAWARNVVLPPFAETCPPPAPPPEPRQASCRDPSHGIEKYARTFDVNRVSGWRDGGYDQTKWCNDVILMLRGEHPNAIFSVKDHGERKKSKCAPFNCPLYEYNCTVEVSTDPVYRLQASAACR